MRPLVGPDAQVFRLLVQVVAIGKHRRAWNRTDVVRVAHAHLGGNAHARAIEAAHKRAEQAEAHAQLLKERVRELEAQLRPAVTEPWQPPTPISHHRIVELTPLQARIFTEYAKGRPQQDIADDLGMGRTAVTNHIHRATAEIGADSPQHAMSLVLRNVVEIRVRTRRKAAA